MTVLTLLSSGDPHVDRREHRRGTRSHFNPWLPFYSISTIYLGPSSATSRRVVATGHRRIFPATNRERWGRRNMGPADALRRSVKGEKLRK